jgi:hypothetical protein
MRTFLIGIAKILEGAAARGSWREFS